MTARFSAPSQSEDEGKHSRIYWWFSHYQSKLFILSIVAMTLLLFIHLFMITFHAITLGIATIVQVTAILLQVFVSLSVVWRGIIPTIICILGITLIYDSIMLPYLYSADERDKSNLDENKSNLPQYSSKILLIAVNMHFILGTSLVVFSMTIAYKPSLLFTRNRPESVNSHWSKYFIWQANTL